MWQGCEIGCDSKVFCSLRKKKKDKEVAEVWSHQPRPHENWQQISNFWRIAEVWSHQPRPHENWQQISNLWRGENATLCIKSTWSRMVNSTSASKHSWFNMVQYGSTMWFKSMLACFRKYHVISLVLIDKRPYLPSMSKPDLSLLMMAEIWGSTLAQSPVVPFGHIAGYVKYRDDFHWFSTSMRFFDHLWPKQIGSIQSFKCVVIVLCQSERIRHPSASPFLRREVVGSQNLPDLGWWMSRNMANARWFNGETCSGLHYSRISMCDNVTFEDLLFWETGWAVYRNSVSTRSRSRLEYIRINIIAGLVVDIIMNMFIAIPAARQWLHFPRFII